MRQWLSVILCIVLCSVTVSYAEKSKSQNAAASIKGLMEISGTKKTIDMIPQIMLRGLTRYKAQMQPEVYQLFNRAIMDSYSGELLNQTVAEYLRKSFRQGYCITALTWYRSTLGKKITDLEVHMQQLSTSADSQSIEKKMAQQLKLQPPTAERRRLIENLDKSASITEMNMEFAMHLFPVIEKAVDPFRPPKERLKTGELEQIVRDERVKNYPVVKSHVEMFLFYAYQSLTDQELQALLEFSESPSGQWFVKNRKAGLLLGLNKAAEKAGIVIRKAYSQTTP